MLIVSLIVLQVIIFGGLIFMLRKILTQNVAVATKHLDELNQDYTKKEEEASRQLEEARQKSQEMVDKAREEADGLKEKTIKETAAESENMLKQARSKSEDMIQQADKARQLLLADINERISNEAVNKATMLVQGALPEKIRKDVHVQWVEDLLSGGFVQFENLSIPKDAKEIKITSAFSLSDAERKVLFKKIKDSIGRELEIKEDVDLNIVAGIIISVGNLVLDGSFRNRIQEQAKSAKNSDSGQ